MISLFALFSLYLNRCSEPTALVLSIRHGLFLCWGWYFHLLRYKQVACSHHTIMGLQIKLEQVPFFATYSLFDITHENMWLQVVLLLQLLAVNSNTWSLWAQSKHVGEFCFWLFWWWENYFLAKRMPEASWWKFLILWSHFWWKFLESLSCIKWGFSPFNFSVGICTGFVFQV